MNINFIFYSIIPDFENFHRRREIEAIASKAGKDNKRVIYFNPPAFFIKKFLFKYTKHKNFEHPDIKICNLYTLCPMSWALKYPFLQLLFVATPIKIQTWYYKKQYLSPADTTISWFYKPDQYSYLKSLKPYIYLHYDNYKGDESYQFNKSKNFDATVNDCISNSLMTLICSAKLFEHYTLSNPSNVYYYPNAISRSLLQHQAADFNQTEEKVIGFIGQLDDSFDFSLLEKIASNFSDYKISLIGEVKNKIILDIAAKYSNIELLGYVSYENLSPKIKTFAIGICPYKQTDFNQYRNPLKISEYFSYGLPVVSVECDIDKGARKMVAVASSHNEFLELLKKELNDNNEEKAELRKAFTQNNCWDNRATFILDNIIKNNK